MLDTGGGGGYGGTNWSSVSVIDMWLAVGNQNTTPHWELLTGWRKSYELTLQHMAAVKNYRENLATAWPPEKSAASAAYIGRLDNLIEHLQHTYDAAVANYGAFSSATLALSSARGDLEKVVDEYLVNQGKLAAFEKEQADKPPTGGLTRRPVPNPPVAAGRQSQLEAQARTIMYGLSTEIIQARAQIRQPKQYSANLIENPGSDEDPGGPTPPPIPPIGSYYPESNALTSTGPSGQHGTTNPNVPAPSANPSRLPGLVLGGVQAPASSPPPMPPVSPPTVGSPLPSPIAPPLPVPSRPHAMAPSIGAGRGFIGDGMRSAIVPGQSAGIRALPPGGIIGTLPGSVPGQPLGGARPGPTVNPVGGVISPNNGARANATGRTMGQPVTGLTGRGGISDDSPGQQKKWDPDNPWETAEGVAPVLIPAAEQKVDPGPAIGLG